MNKKGMTLIEMLLVLTLIGILLAIIVPSYQKSIVRTKEAVLKENLFIIRDTLRKYYLDKKKYPTALEELVTFRYIQDVPVDPFTGKKEWKLVYDENVEPDELDPEAGEGIIDVKSLSDETAQDGSKYSEW